MTKVLFWTIFSCCILTISCKESPPIIVPCQTDRVVLVEEFTGMACTNCPQGHQKIKELQQEYPGQIIPIGIHAGFKASPNSDFQGFDFRTPDGNGIHDYVIPTGYPSLVINRKRFEGQGQIDFTLVNTWAGPIAEEICSPPDAAVKITSVYDLNNREATITVGVEGVNQVKMLENIALSVMVTESHIIAPQETSNGWDNDYEHNHVLRDVVTERWGDKLQEKGSVLETHQRTFTYSIPSDWVAENCHIVALVHYQGSSNRYILQAAEEKLIN